MKKNTKEQQIAAEQTFNNPTLLQVNLNKNSNEFIYIVGRNQGLFSLFIILKKYTYNNISYLTNFR